MLKLAVASLALGLANAEYDSCSRPKGQWVAVDQGNGRSFTYGVTVLGSNVFAAGHSMGNMTFSSNHITNGASGEVTNHADVPVVHNTRTYTAGRYSDVTSSQLGMDAVIYKISTAGVPDAVFSVDSYTSDGVYPNSENGNWGNYVYYYGADNFEKSSDTTSIVAVGVFRGNLSIPVTSTGSGTADSTVELSNRKSGSYDVWAVKINTVTMAGIWASALQTPVGRQYVRAGVKTFSNGDVILTAGKRPSSAYIGRVAVFNGATGAQTFLGDYDACTYLYGLATIGTHAFVGGRCTGTAINPFGTGAFTTTTNEVVITKMTSAGVGVSTIHFGSGYARSIADSPDGNHIYVAGSNSAAATLGSCSLTGASGGFLLKLSATDLSCVWAKDIPSLRKLAVDATHLYGATYDDDPMTFGTTTLNARGTDSDIFVLKFAVADGAGLWGTSVGGTGRERVYDIALAPSGLVIAGYAQSASINIAGVTINNLQHARSGTTGANGGYAALVASFDLAGQTPTCLSGCSTTTSAAGVTVSTGNCYSDGQCYANGANDQFRQCFSCAAATSQTTMAGPDTTNHCYIAGVCVATGSQAPAYQRYNQASVCETCNPTVSTSAYSLAVGYIHDRDVTRTEPGRQGRRLSSANAFGMIFAGSSNGCQTLPGLQMPASPNAALTAALAAHTHSATAVAATEMAAAVTAATSISTAGSAGTLATITRAANGEGEFGGLSAAVRKAAIDVMVVDNLPMAVAKAGFTNTALANWQALWAYYNGNAATCTKVAPLSASRGTAAANLLCANTPSATAEAHADLFGTTLYYGNAIAVVKSKQAMALGAANAEAATPDASRATSYQLDTDMHMMVPYYQGVLAMARQMDAGANATVRKTAQVKAYAYFALIEPMLLVSGEAEASALATMLNPLATPAGGSNATFCAAKNLLQSHLPNASSLQYSMGTSSSATPSAAASDTLVSFNFEEDIGTMPLGAASVVCAPYTAPAPLPAATHFVNQTFTVAGVPEDYTPAVVDAMKIQIAAAMAVDVRAVDITVTSGSVIISIGIQYTSATAAEAGATAINALTATPAAASAFLSTPMMSVTVSAVTAPTAGTGDSGFDPLIIIIIAAVAAVLLLVIVVISCKRKGEGKPIFVCLDESGKKEDKKGAAGNA